MDHHTVTTQLEDASPTSRESRDTEMKMEHVVFALSSAAVEHHTSASISALTVASVSFGKIAGRKDHLMLDVVRNVGAVSGGLDRQGLDRHMKEMLNSGAMKFRPSPHFKDLSATLEVWRDKGAIVITQNAGPQGPSEGADSLGSLLEPECLCAVCLKSGIEPRFLATPPENVEEVIRLFSALEFQE